MLIDESMRGFGSTSTFEGDDQFERSLLQTCGSYERYYDPLVGRFISEDPLRQAGGDDNLQTYVGNNPIKNRDPSGHEVDPRKKDAQASIANPAGMIAPALPGVGPAVLASTPLPTIPAAFSSYGQYVTATSKLQAQLSLLDPEIQVGFQGSAVSGYGYQSKLAFGLHSDLDMAYVSKQLLDDAKGKFSGGIRKLLLAGKQTRFGPIAPLNLSDMEEIQQVLQSDATPEEMKTAIKYALRGYAGEAAANELGMLDPMKAFQARIGGRELGGMLFQTREDAFAYAARTSGTMWFEEPSLLQSLYGRAAPTLRLSGHALQLAGPVLAAYSIARSDNKMVEGQVQINSQVLGGVATYSAYSTGSGAAGLTAAGAAGGLSGTFITGYALDYAMQARMTSDRTEAKLRSDMSMPSNANLRNMAQSESFNSYEHLLQVKFADRVNGNHMLARFRFWRSEVEGGLDIPMPDDIRSAIQSDTSAGF